MVTNVSVLSTERVFPQQRHRPTLGSEKNIVLSLLDATSANFSVSGAVWFLEPCSGAIASTFFSRLRESLSITLNAYSPWCGHLRQVPYRPDLGHDHLHRFGRLQLTYDRSLDPGVEVVFAESSATLDDFVPRKVRPALWNMHEIPLDSFTPQTDLASPLQDPEDCIKPAVAIQITQLSDNGAVLAIKMAHPLADAHTLAKFTSDWGRITKSQIDNSPLPTVSVVFDPTLLDRQAAGDINQPSPNPELLQEAERLPLHRYDWWAPSSGCPWPQEVPEPFRSKSSVNAGKPLPWSEWDVTKPVSHYVVHLTAEQVERVWQDVSSKSSIRLSRHDAIVAHIWSCVNRARGLEGDEGQVHCDLVVGMRSRLSLGDNFLGSATIMIDVAMQGSNACSTDIAPLATAVRSTLGKIDRRGLQAHLYSVAYEKSPQRIWQAFLGTRHILVTSWVHAGVYNIDFGAGITPRYVEALMPDLDGIIELKEGPPTNLKNTPAGRSWTETGVDISIHLRSDAMERLLEDPHLLP